MVKTLDNGKVHKECRGQHDPPGSIVRTPLSYFQECSGTTMKDYDSTGDPPDVFACPRTSEVTVVGMG